MGGMDENTPNPFCQIDETSLDLSGFSELETVDQKLESPAAEESFPETVI